MNLLQIFKYYLLTSHQNSQTQLLCEIVKSCQLPALSSHNFNCLHVIYCIDLNGFFDRRYKEKAIKTVIKAI